MCRHISKLFPELITEMPITNQTIIPDNKYNISSSSSVNQIEKMDERSDFKEPKGSPSSLKLASETIFYNQLITLPLFYSFVKI